VMSFLTSDIQKYLTLWDCPYCHDTSAIEMARNPSVVRCNTCGLWRASPRMNKEGQVYCVKQLDDEFDVTNYESPLDPSYAIDEVRALKRNFPDMSSKSWVLDVGAADGRFMAALRYADFPETVGLEPMAKIAGLGRSAGLDIHVGRFETDGMPPALAGRIFDLVCFREDIYYMADWREAFDLLRRILRPGGGLYIRGHVPTSIYYSKEKNYFTRYGPGVTGMPTLKALTAILTKEGFEVRKAGYLPFDVFHTLGRSLTLPFPIGGMITLASYSVLSVIGKGDRLLVKYNLAKPLGTLYTTPKRVEGNRCGKSFCLGQGPELSPSSDGGYR